MTTDTNPESVKLLPAMACRKHKPVPLEGGNILDQLAGRVQCENCGMRGQYSRGRRAIGRPPRVIWFRRPSLICDFAQETRP